MRAYGKLSLTETRFGQAIAARGGGKWRHPWQVTPAWLGAAGRWVAHVWPGFVNGRVPIVHAVSDEKQVEIPLYLDPAIGLTFRAVGADGNPREPVPKFFLERGVQEAVRIDLDAVLESGVLPDLGRPRPLRLLRACDLVLHQPRVALTSQVTLEPGPATGISNVTQTLTLRRPQPGDTLRIFAGRYDGIEEQPIDPLFGGVAGLYEEKTWDELLIATVYLLSPPNTELGSEPDGTWQPFVRHGLFWNLNYQVPNLRLFGGDPSLPFIPPLAAGAAQPVINFLTASLNDATQQTINTIAAHSMAGIFWTPTGSGHLSEFPQPAAARASRLDPPFPFHGPGFDPELLAA